MITTTPTPPKVNNAIHANGFPNLNRVPEVLHNFLHFIRKSNPLIVLEYVSEPDAKTETIIIKYPTNYTIPGIVLLDKLLSETPNPQNNITDQYRLKKFSQVQELPTVIILKKR